MNPLLSAPSVRWTETKLSCIHSAFEDQASERPAAVALSFGDQDLSYADLNAAANQLAHHLQHHGVRPETPVAIYLDRSFHMVIAILAVLKAGGTYVPIDLAYPLERVDFILKDTRAPILLTTSNLAKAFSGFPTTRVICLDTDQHGILCEKAENPVPSVSPANAAYIIFTSGSTGKSKGVVVTHHNVVRLLHRTAHWYGFGPSDVWPLFHSYAFDVSVWELWGSLFHGGRLVIVPYLVTRSPQDFYELLAREKITVLNQTPSAFRQLIWAEENAPGKQPLALRYVICAGEALELQSLKPWFNRHGDQHPTVVNMYGITETTVHSTYRPIRLADLQNRGSSPIGIPIPDLQIRLLDDRLEPVPAGVPGEICVSGEGVARGYLNRPDLTEARFLPDPCSADPAARMYRSGDLARINSAGELEYLGRIDFQVKIRGFRVELGEIESALNRHAMVRESCVVACETPDGDKRLVGYVVPVSAPPTVTELRKHLAQVIPEYMIPAVFLFLARFPLNANGKIDRRALPDPGLSRPNLQNPFLEARNPVETTLAGIWAEVLHLQQVGVNDNFFELGGDSIRSIQILAKAQKAGLGFTLQQILDHPTIAGLAGIHKAVKSPETILSAPFSGIDPGDLALLGADIEDAYPITSLQLGMFYHNELDPLSAIYHDVFSFAITAPLDEAKLSQALNQLLQRHPVLRTSFHLAGFSKPLQLVHRLVVPPFTLEDLRQLDAARQEQAVAQWIEIEKRNAFDRATAPLVRFHVQQHSGSAFQFFISFHHACLDGWSLAAVITEVFQDYSSFLQTGLPAGIVSPAARYREFVDLECATARSPDSRAFWSMKLLEAPSQKLPRWPEALRTSAHEQSRGPEIGIEPEVFARLKQLSHSAGVPLKSVLLAAHQKVMSCLCGQQDVITGLVMNGRPEVLDGERLVGLFLNTIPLRSKLDSPSWLGLIRQVFDAERELIPHRRYPIAELHKANHGQALFESAFDFVHFHVYEQLRSCGKLDLQEGHYFEANNLTTYTTFLLDVDATTLRMHIDYDPNEICLRQVENINAYYTSTLREIAQDPNGRPDHFSPLAENEKHQLLRAWNSTQRDYPRDACIHELFEARAKETPGACAVMFGDQMLSYADLDRRADELAAILAHKKVGQGRPVALCLERCPDLLIALLAILKTGAAYVPLDPAYPPDRLSFMVEDSQASLILTQHSIATLFSSGSTPVLCLEDASLSSPRSGGPIRPYPAAVSTDLAYVIYTSGSTGRPKGVEITHRSVVNLLLSAAETAGFTAADHLLAVTTLSFDIAALELFMPLVTGARLTLASREIAADPIRLGQLIESSGATLMQATPSTWSMLVETGWKSSLSLTIFCGGESLQPLLAQALCERSRAVWNFYGPTETTIWSTAWLVAPSQPVSIGTPLANTAAYILDSKLQPVPVGTVGELYLAGDGLARGYHLRPELTAERFLPNRFSGFPDDRMYRTGDLARRLPDGTIECLGRVDHQVKIRGHRIEPGEIQAALRLHPEIADALVTAAADKAGGQHLVAYLISRNGPPDTRQIREHLRHRLPEFMVPAHFVRIERFPLTPNGKIDLRGLPTPGQTAENPETCIAPRTACEQALAAIWSEVLLRNEIGIDTNFFDAGGDSLSATRVFARINRAFKTDLALKQLFQHPTIRSLAEIVAGAPTQVQPRPIVRQPRALPVQS